MWVSSHKLKLTVIRHEFVYFKILRFEKLNRQGHFDLFHRMPYIIWTDLFFSRWYSKIIKDPIAFVNYLRFYHTFPAFISSLLNKLVTIFNSILFYIYTPLFTYRSNSALVQLVSTHFLIIYFFQAPPSSRITNFRAAVTNVIINKRQNRYFQHYVA